MKSWSLKNKKIYNLIKHIEMTKRDKSLVIVVSKEIKKFLSEEIKKFV